jgi:hypothetical protein
MFRVDLSVDGQLYSGVCGCKTVVGCLSLLRNFLKTAGGEVCSSAGPTSCFLFNTGFGLACFYSNFSFEIINVYVSLGLFLY